MIVGNFVLITIIGLHPFAMLCIMYPWYFSAKTIKLAELQKTVNFVEFIGDFSLFWFLPIGIWVLQPRINELVKIDTMNPTKED